MRFQVIENDRIFHSPACIITWTAGRSAVWTVETVYQDGPIQAPNLTKGLCYAKQWSPLGFRLMLSTNCAGILKGRQPIYHPKPIANHLIPEEIIQLTDCKPRFVPKEFEEFQSDEFADLSGWSSVVGDKWLLFWHKEVQRYSFDNEGYPR